MTVYDVENPMTLEAADLTAVTNAVLDDPRLAKKMEAACEAAIASKFSTVDSKGVKTLNGLIFALREFFKPKGA